MKKFIIRLLIALVVIVIIAAVAMALSLNWVIKKGVQTVGGNVTKVDVKLSSVNLSLLSGVGEFKGLVVGNPPGFATPWAINVGTLRLAVEPRSLLSDKIIIRSIAVEAPEIIFETDLRANNLSKILANVQGPPGNEQQRQAQPSGAAQPKEAKSSKKFQVDDFLIKDAKVRVSVTSLGGQPAVVPLPEIHLQDLGKGPEGITAAELTQKILEAVETAAAQASSGAISDLGHQALNMAQDRSKQGTGNVQNVTKSLGDLLRKK
jgi:uncharacterized protein involved in outer membrane biogenesis